jgi:hypothetical protein
MSQKLAIKRLTASDLTFFEWHFRRTPAVRQKAINLNADVFVEHLYPGLNDPSAEKRFPVDLFIFGPGLEGAINLQRKILKPPGAKNWRLNGELVNDINNSSRFNLLAAGDFAILDFNEGMSPKTLTLVLVATAVKEDKELHRSLDQVLGSNSMLALSSSQLEQLINAANPVPEHPIYELTLDITTLNADLEDVALGGNQGKEKLMRGAASRTMSRATLLKAKESADIIGLRGEQFVNNYLNTLKNEGTIRDFEWTSSSNAISPYDFWINHDGTTRVLVDVKSTQGEFERTLHISLSELQQMSTGTQRYDIYRVFGIEEDTAQIRIAENVGDFARQVLAVLQDLPQGIIADSISVSPTLLSFGPAFTLEITDELEDV